MDTSTMSTKGQVVIPKKVRETLQAGAGSRLGFRIDGDQVVVYVIKKNPGMPSRDTVCSKGRANRSRSASGVMR